MFDVSIFGDETLRTQAALYGCTICPPPGESCPDDPWGPGPRELQPTYSF